MDSKNTAPPLLQGGTVKGRRSILVQQTKNVQAARQIRFTQVREIARREAIIKAYVQEAMEVEKPA